MSYLKRSDVTAEPGHSVFQIGSHLVSVRVEVKRDAVTNRSGYLATAGVVDAAGEAVRDAQGGPITSSATHTASAEAVGGAGEFLLLREMALLVLGEPPTLVEGEPLVAWSPEYRRDASILTAIASAQRTGTAPLHMLM